MQLIAMTWYYNLHSLQVHHGLCWADVAIKVKTRTDKQCRAKWLNFLNWKQKGGTDWAGPADDCLLLEKYVMLFSWLDYTVVNSNFSPL